MVSVKSFVAQADGQRKMWLKIIQQIWLRQWNLMIALCFLFKHWDNKKSESENFSKKKFIADTENNDAWCRCWNIFSLQWMPWQNKLERLNCLLRTEKTCSISKRCSLKKEWVNLIPKRCQNDWSNRSDLRVSLSKFKLLNTSKHSEHSSLFCYSIDSEKKSLFSLETLTFGKQMLWIISQKKNHFFFFVRLLQFFSHRFRYFF